MHTDALGSPVAYTSSTGSVLAGRRTQYEPYGTPTTTPRNGEPSYTGHQYDQTTGLIYAQARYYDPALGRFLGVDPMAVDTTSAFNFNRYAYGNNSPYKFTDPDGRAGIMVAPIVVAAVIVAGGYYVLTHMPANTGSSQSDGLSGLLGTSNTLPIFTKQLNEATTPEGQTGDAEEPEFTDVEGNKAPWQGEPGSTVRAGMGSRTYGGDGYPVTDRERGHPDEDGCGSEEHCHDWGRPEGGGKVTHGDRGPPRVPQPGDPPSPRGPNVPPPDPMIPEGI